MVAMSRLLRAGYPSSYFPLSQDNPFDDEDKLGKALPHGPGKHPIWSHWVQFVLITILLLLAGTAGFFIALSLPQNRLAPSPLPDTVPQG